jgi:mRNA interferase MazF
VDVVSARQFDVWIVVLDPTVGAEIRKTRPCVVVSPDEMNNNLRTAIIAPLTSTVRAYPSRVRVSFQGREGDVALDQLRAVDRSRLLKRIGAVSSDAKQRIVGTLVEMWA